MTRVAFDIDVRRATAWLCSLSVIVLLLGYVREIYVATFGYETPLKDLRHIALDTEHCLGSFYSSALMGIAALLLAILGQREAPGLRRVQWFALSIIFVAMSLDESVSFHEILIDPLRPVFAFSSYLHFAWIVPGALFTLLVGAAYIPFVFAFSPAIRNRIILSGFLYVTGALGFEAVGGHFNSIGGFEHPLYTAAFLVEESLEIIGLTLFATTLLKLLPDHTPDPARDTAALGAPAE